MFTLTCSRGDGSRRDRGRVASRDSVFCGVKPPIFRSFPISYIFSWPLLTESHVHEVSSMREVTGSIPVVPPEPSRELGLVV